MTLSYVGKSSAATAGNGTTSLAAPVPSGVAAGDQLVATVAVCTGANVDAPVTTVPSGWTFVGGAYDAGSGGGIRVNVYQRTAGSSEPASYTWAAAAVSGRIAITIAAYRGANPIIGSEFVTSGLGGGSGSSSATRTTGTLTLSSSQTGRWLVAVFADPRGSTQSFSVSDTVRDKQITSNTDYVVEDTGATVAAGTYSKSATVAVLSNTGVQILYAIGTSTNPLAATAAASSNVVLIDATGTTGGTPPYTYAVSPSTGTSQPAAGIFTAQPATAYTVTATDSLGATSSASVVTAAAVTTINTYVRSGGAWN